MSKSRKLGRLRPSPALIVAVAALVFAVSGVAVALPGKNSVATKDIKKNAVTAAKIKDGAVTTSKLGNDAVTGAKVNEATLGKVPSAGTADTAVKATTAETAVKATEATKAAEATKATSATNSAELEGRTLTQVRPVAVGAKETNSEGLQVGTFESVFGVNITVPTGGADVLLTATVQLDNNDGSPASGSCRLRFDGTVTGNTVTVTLPSGNDTSVALSGFANNAGAGLSQALVECSGSNGENDVQFVHGDLMVQAIPVGS